MKKALLKHKQILFFIIAGGLSAIIEIGSFKLFSTTLPLVFQGERDFFGIHFPLSNILSTTLGILSNYFFSIWFVFQRGKHSKKREFTYFMAISFASTLVSLGLFQIFFSFIFNAHLDIGFFTFSQEMMSKILAIVVVAFLNYSIKKRIIFQG